MSKRFNRQHSLPRILNYLDKVCKCHIGNIDRTGGFIHITLPNVNYGHGKHEVTVEQPVTRYHVESFDRVVALFKGHETLTRKDIQLALGISQASAINLLREWVNAGILQVIGQGRNTRYRLK